MEKLTSVKSGQVLLNNKYMYYNKYLLNFHFFSDPRTRKWFFVPSILSPLSFVVTYLLLVWLLPKVMKNREPFQLTNLLVLYNAAMTLLNLYICVEVSETKYCNIWNNI